MNTLGLTTGTEIRFSVSLVVQYKCDVVITIENTIDPRVAYEQYVP